MQDAAAMPARSWAATVMVCMAALLQLVSCEPAENPKLPVGAASIMSLSLRGLRGGMRGVVAAAAVLESGGSLEVRREGRQKPT